MCQLMKCGCGGGGGDGRGLPKYHNMCNTKLGFLDISVFKM